MKTGLILEGGAYRGIFTTGVLKVLKNYNTDFQYIAGVSAGAGNITDFISGREDLTRKFFVVSKKNNTYGVKPLLKTGYLLNVETMVKNLMSLDDKDIVDSILNSTIDIEIVCTNAITGRPEYLFESKSTEKLLEICKASCSVPIISRPVFINNVPYFDGSVSDAIPLRRAIETKKCDKTVVILTKPVGENHTDYSKAAFLINVLYHKKYPAIEKLLFRRLEDYAKELEYVDKMEREGVAFVVRPTIASISRFEKDETKIKNYYTHGVNTMEMRMDEFKRFMEK